MGMRSSPKLTSSSKMQLSRAMPMVQNKITIRAMATSNVPSSRADSELVEFLTEEIAAEEQPEACRGNSWLCFEERGCRTHIHEKSRQ